MRGCRWPYLAGLLLGLLAGLGAQAGPPVEPPGDGFLAFPREKPREQPPVWFSHRSHESRQVACRQCHHDYQGKVNLWNRGQPVKKCSACHREQAQDGRLDLENAVHRQCKGCHLKLRQQAQKPGPTDCQECHRQDETAPRF